MLTSSQKGGLSPAVSSRKSKLPVGVDAEAHVLKNVVAAALI